MSLVLAGSFGLLTGLSVALVLYFSVSANYRNTVSLLGEKSLLLIEIMKKGVRDRLDPAKRALVHFRKLYAEGDFEISDPQRIPSILRGAMVANDAVEAWIIYDKTFKQTGIYREADGKLLMFDDPGESDKGVRELLLELTPADGVEWSPLVHNEFGVYSSVATVLVRNGQIDGYMVAATNISFLSALAAEIGDSYGATAFILEAPYKLIAHSLEEQLKLDEQRGATQPSIPLGIVRDDVLRLFPFTDPEELFEEIAEEGIEVRIVETADNAYVAISGMLQDFGPNPWTMGVYFERSANSDEIRRLFLSAAAGLVALILAVMIAVWLGRRIARPITANSEQFGRIANLDLDNVTELPPSRIREIDQEARSFNSMLKGLRAFTAYVPRSLARKLLRSGLEKAGQSRETELTVLFTDIADFTDLSETLPAAQTVELLNHHFRILVSCIEYEDGTVDKYLGDGLLAFWNAPDETRDHAGAAVRAAIAIRQAIISDNAEARAEGRPEIRIRIGIHTGSVIVGNIGALDRVNYTIVGDTVNLCQRLQGLGKEAAPDDQVAILLSEETRRHLEEDHAAEALGNHLVKGRKAPVFVWHLPEGAARSDADPEPAARKAVLAEALPVSEPERNA